MLDLLSYPVSFVLLCWHDVLTVLVPAAGAAWCLAIVLLVVTLRLLLLRPALAQARSAARLRELQPHIATLREKHGHDRARLTAELRQLHADHGVSPVAGCAQLLLQLPVLIGLSHLVYSLGRAAAGAGRFVFGAADVHSFETARLASGRIISGLLEFGGGAPHLSAQVTIASALVSLTLIVVAAVGAHVNARLAMRTSPSPADGVARWTRRLMLWGMPAGAVVAGPYLATAILVYWATNTLCTLAQTVLLARLSVRPAPA